MAKVETSPFSPGKPVATDLFVGRSQELNRLRQLANQVAHGRQENVFLVGERGMGKSSLAAYFKSMCETQMGFLAAQVYLGGVDTLDMLVKRTFDALLKQSSGRPVFAKLRELFGKHVREVGLFGVTVEFDAAPAELADLKNNFLPALRRLHAEIGGSHKGILLILDDLNGITRNPEMAHFLKSLVDEIATSGQPLPLMLVLGGVEERMAEMAAVQPSVARIFHRIEIAPLEEAEARIFYERAFASVNMTIEPDALSFLPQFAGGIPMFLHEIGDATFWSDEDGNISVLDSGKGFAMAVQNVGEKYLEPVVYRALRSTKYRAILRKITGKGSDMEFTKGEVETDLTPEEAKVLDNFLQRMKKLGVLKSSEEERGRYRFANRLFRTYMALEAQQAAGAAGKKG